MNSYLDYCNVRMTKKIAGIDTDLFFLASVATTVFLYGFMCITVYPQTNHIDDTEVAIDPYCVLYDTINCANGGVLVKTSDTGFTCKCTENYYGENCKNAKFYSSISWLTRVFYNSDTETRRGKPTMWWSFLPFTSDIQLKTIYRFHQNNMKKLKIHSDISNDREEGLNRPMSSLRILPPIRPFHCLESNKLPPLMALYDNIFERKHDQFKPDPKHRNLLYQAFYQYFVLQFFDTNFNLTITASQLYGSDEVTRRELRSFSNGKLKTKCLKKEHYPPYLSSAKHVKMVYHPMKRILQTHWFNKIIMDSEKAQSPKWAMGHPLLSMNPMLFVMSTLWVREHNRVCDILLRQWPAWTDDQIYMTARNIVIGQMTRIMMNDVINVVHPYSLKHKPELFDDIVQNINCTNTPIELLLISMGSSSLPDNFNNVTMDSVLFGNNRHVLVDGMSDTIKYMVGQEMGMITHRNDGTAMRPLTKLIMKLSRENALQSFNNYRRYLGLYPYRNFYGLTNDWKTVSTLELLYDNVEDVELLTGMLVEKRNTGTVSTVEALTNSIIINSILTNSLSSKGLWRRDTFGGNVGFDIVKSANIESLICNNLVDKCDGFKVKFYVN